MALSRYADSFPGSATTTLYGPAPATGVSSGGVPVPQFTPGQIVTGDRGGEWTFCSLVLASTTTLANGQAYQFDKDFLATAITTTNTVRGYNVGIASVSQASVVAGTYYFWLQTSGHAGVQFTGAAAALAETTATAGLVNFTNTPTTGAKTLVGLYMFQVTATFTADITNLSATIINVSSLADVSIGATITGTGIPSSTTIVSKGTVNGNLQIVMSAAATATNTGVTVTAVGVQTGNVIRPYVDKTN